MAKTKEEISEYNRKWRAEHPNYASEWWSNNGSRYDSTARSSAWKTANPDKFKAWVENNRQKLRDYSKKWSKANPEKVKEIFAKWASRNKEKLNKKSLAWAKAHPKYVNAQSAKWRKANPEKVKSMKDAWYAANKEKHAATLKAWAQKNKHVVAASASKRRATKHHAQVAWRNEFFISEIYHLAKLRTESLGIRCHVDHIVPLQSKVVCGLHNEFNLRVIQQRANLVKGNRVWPQMNFEKNLYQLNRQREINRGRD